MGTGITGNIAIYVLAAQSAAVIISAISVISTILWNRILVRRRATLDMLLSEQTDKLFLEMRSEYLQAVNRNDLATFAEPDKWYMPESFFLSSVLNRCDLVAIGISEGIIDERIFKRYWRAAFVRDWVRSKQSVHRRREIRKDPTLFVDFEQLARRWATPEELLLF